jgi:hypothetical protein
MLWLGFVRGNGRALALPAKGRSTHLYVCGGSGVGKSKLLEHLIRQDIKAWPASKCGLLLLDPHGSVYFNLLDWLAANGDAALKRPVVLVDLAQDRSIVAYNVLRPRDRASRSVVIDALGHILLCFALPPAFTDAHSMRLDPSAPTSPSTPDTPFPESPAARCRASRSHFAARTQCRQDSP